MDQRWWWTTFWNWLYFIVIFQEIPSPKIPLWIHLCPCVCVCVHTLASCHSSPYYRSFNVSSSIYFFISHEPSIAQYRASSIFFYLLWGLANLVSFDSCCFSLVVKPSFPGPTDSFLMSPRYPVNNTTSPPYKFLSRMLKPVSFEPRDF